MDASIVLLITRVDEAKKCIDSLAVQSFTGNWELVIVTSPEFKDLTDNLDLNIQLIIEKDKNPAVRRNRGWQKASSDIVAFIDDDLICDKNWLRNGIEFLKLNQHIGIMGGPDKVRPNAGFGEQVTDYILKTPFIGSGVLAHTEYPADKEIPSASSLALCNIFIRKDVLEKVGGFNGNLGYIGEDTEFIYTAREKFGIKGYYKADVVVYHKKRSFPVEYIKQRFFYRKKNGILLYAYPELYLYNYKFLVFFLVMTAGLLSWIISFKLFTVLVALYFVAVWSLTAKYFFKRPVLLPMLTFGFPVHHLTYYIGIWAGLISGLINIKKKEELKR